MTARPCIPALCAGTSHLTLGYGLIIMVVLCRYLSQRGGNTPLTHSITYFDHVRIPAYSLLGKFTGPVNHRQSFFEAISRVPYGTIALSSLAVPALQIMSTICARYSMRRTVFSNEEIQKPILSFRTQQVPILTALAQAYVMRALFDASIKLFTDASLDFRVRHAIATATKSVMVCHTQKAALELGERCGAQGCVCYFGDLFCHLMIE